MTAWAELREGRNRIDAILDQQRAAEESRWHKEAKENREFLATIVDSLLFLAKQNIAIWGHDESSTSSIRRDFLELLDLMASLNPHFKTHLDKAREHSKNATYLSSDIQNELLDISAGLVRETIVNEVKKAGIFSIGIDETSDVSRPEQVSIVLRYVDSTGEIQELLLEMEHVSSTTAEALLDLVKVVFDSFGLELKNLKGQFYDGCPICLVNLMAYKLR